MFIFQATVCTLQIVIMLVILSRIILDCIDNIKNSEPVIIHYTGQTVFCKTNDPEMPLYPDIEWKEISREKVSLFKRLFN